MTGSLPELLILFRALCAPAIFVLACFAFPGWLLAGILAAAFLSDIFDGVIARRLGIATPALRHADTLVDTVFYVSAAAATAIAVPAAFAGAGLLLAALVAVHVSRATFELTKYGRLASYHMWSAKALGNLLAAAMGWTLASGQPHALLAWALGLGIGNELEGCAASAILPAWQADVPSVVHALSVAAATSSASSRDPGLAPPSEAVRLLSGPPV
jgi:phosphatidylglycerophosphate synthase